MGKQAVLGVLVLLTSLRIAMAWQGVEGPDGECSDGRTESEEWPAGALECPAFLAGDHNATTCCELCYASLGSGSSVEDIWQDWDWEACPSEDEEQPIASSSDTLAAGLALLFPAVFIMCFFCVWLWQKETHGDPNYVPRFGGGMPSFSRSQLRGRYGACSTPGTEMFAMGTYERQDQPSESGVTNFQSYQSSGEEEDTLPPTRFTTVPEEPESGGDPEEPACGGDLEEPAAPADEAKLT